MLDPDIDVVSRLDGSIIISARQPLNAPSPNVGTLLRTATRSRPDRLLAAARSERDGWRGLDYQEALGRCTQVGGFLLERGLGPNRPVMAIAQNGLEHLVLALAAQFVGIPYVPVSPAYALLGSDRSKIRHVLELVKPGLVFVDSATQMSDTLSILQAIDAEIVTRVFEPGYSHFATLSSSVAKNWIAEAQAASRRVQPDAVAKILLTSGSTGLPKAVKHTHAMMMANVEMVLQVWPFLFDQDLVLVDWLPWNHCFGSNNNINMVLRLGGTLYIDDGRPVVGQFERSKRNLAEHPPTFYLNVPAGYAVLVHELECDTEFRRRFFSRLSGFFFAAAALDEKVRARLRACARSEGKADIPILSGWGATETGPTATLLYVGHDHTGNIGLPAPGVSLKLAPVGEKFELRVKSPSVTPGYLGAEADTAKAFDSEVYYRTGDAGRLVDSADASLGILFDGRLNDDFKLANGTWVSFASLRAAILSNCTKIKDVVVCGHDRAYLTLMVWLNAETRADDAATMTELKAALLGYNSTVTGASRRIERVVIQQKPLSFDLGEITEKGTINQRAVRLQRSDVVDALYAEQPSSDVMILG